MKVTLIQTLVILGAAATSTNAASLRGADEQTARKGVSETEHARRKGGDPDDMVSYKGYGQTGRKGPREQPVHAARKGGEPEDEMVKAARKGRVVPRHITLAVKNDEELNKLLGGTKKNREPDHMVAYSSSGGYGVKNDEELNKLLGGTKGPDHMMAYASSGGYGNEYEPIGGGGYGGERGNFFGTPEVKHGRIEAPAPRNRGANVGLN